MTGFWIVYLLFDSDKARISIRPHAVLISKVRQVPLQSSFNCTMQNNSRIKVPPQQHHQGRTNPQNLRPSQPSPQNYQVPICSFRNGTSITILLYILTLILGTLNVGIIGYNFGYYKGSYRTSLFHSELTFLVIFSIAFVMNLTSLVISLFTRVSLCLFNLFYQ